MKQQYPTPSETGLLRLRQVLTLIPISRSAWWDGVKKGKYPKGFKLGPQTTVWTMEDIRQVIQQVKSGFNK